MAEDRKNQIYDIVIHTIADISGAALVDLNGRTELIIDLGLDSLAIFEIVIELEAAFDLRISDEAIERIKTIDEVVKFVEQNESSPKGKKV